MGDPEANNPTPDPSPRETTPATDEPQRKTIDQRKELLARTIQSQVAGGARVESQSDFQAVLVRGRRPNHLLHFIIGLVTVGLWWLFVWLPLAIFGGEKRTLANVDEFGHVTVQQM